MTDLTFAHREPIGSSTYPMPVGEFDTVAVSAALAKPARNDMAAVYVHVPFCDQICSFCGFNKFLSTEEIKSRYVDSLIQEISQWSRTAYVQSLRINSVYLGGGTPNSLDPDQLARILIALRKLLPFEEDCQITCEGTARNFTAERNAALLENGVTRISAGVQTFDRSIRESHLNMSDGEEDVLGYIDQIKQDFADFNLDMIFNLPGQSDEIWARDLALAIESGSSHLTMYPLVLLEHTAFYTDYVVKGKHQPPSQEREIDLFRATVERLSETPYGDGRYTVRDWAKPGGACRYIDSNARANEVLAFGPGAHGFAAGFTYRTVKGVKAYCDAIAVGEFAIEQQSFCTQRDLMERFFVMGLRLRKFDTAGLVERFGEPIPDDFSKTLERLVASGYVEMTGSEVTYTEKGHVWANNIRSLFESRRAHVVGYSDTLSIGKTGKDHYSSIARVKATDAETA